METTLLTVDEAAARAGVRPRTIRSWFGKGKITRLRARDGYHVRVSTEELDTFLVERARRIAEAARGIA